ncbi:hypothetical protein CPU12_03970 [Malaciobacter molluscorum LMG 25693]|uniref:Glycosyltransferase, family 1 n=1 Tax=Malaciobacter molluscorum LMG 25693 TaxID=870501 RepID=A0A2G1DK91_9BACT|nr:glycosyltransferase [Malaciobacter molluscorum]AXX92893.1 glycosyltransferase, family 1 [Malaciobacter molluscorum LMG 25693]PHO18726.1 hypothetical protein CPU12_03970 [Malaciobacter molluscorum LMG 25693]
MIKIDYKIETKLIKRLLENENITKIKKRKLSHKLIFKKQEFADIYFFSGNLQKDDEKKLYKAKRIVVNSNRIKNKLIEKFDFDKTKIEVIYPSVSIKNFEEKQKNEFFEKYQISNEHKIIFFTAKDFKKSGIKEFIELIKKINYKYTKFIIAGTKRQISNLKLLNSKYDFGNKVIYLEDFGNIDLLFYICDIFVLPTQQKSFATSILKAMYYKSAVFIPRTNSASEVVDIFATMNRYDDGSTPFKIDALLGRNEDLILIKNDNFNVAKEFNLSNNYSKVMAILQNV